MSPAQTPTVSPIWNLPHPRNPNFTGRAQLLADLHAALTGNDVETGRRPVSTAVALTQTLSGLGGVGKTQLATEYAYRHAAEYDVVWWVRAEETATLAADYACLAQPLNLPEKDARDQRVVVQAVRAWLRTHARWLLICDNAKDPDDLHDYLPQGATGHVLITSRNPSWRSVASPLPVNEMKRDDAIAFLLKRTGEADRDAANKLAAALGDLPLALEQAGAYVEDTAESLATYLKLFEERRSEVLKRGKPSKDYPDTVATTWELSFQQVAQQSPAGAALLNLCAFLAPDDIPKEMIAVGAKHLPHPERNEEESKHPELASPAGSNARVEGANASPLHDPLQFDDAVAALRRFSLIEATSQALSIHRLVQAVARDRLSAEANKTCAEAAVKIVNDGFPGDEVLTDPHSWPTCARLLPHALVVTETAEALGVGTDATGRLLNQAGIYLRGRAQFADAKRLFERALKIDETSYGPDHPEVSTDVNNLGSVLRDLGDLAGAKAHYERALRIDEATYGPDHPDVARDVNNLGSVLQAQGDLAPARAAFERALRIFEIVLGENHPKVATLVNNLGGVLRDLGDLAGAKAHFERALRIDEAAYGPDHPKVAIRVNNLGNVLRDLGDLAGAKAHYERALKIGEATLGPDHPDVARDVWNLGVVYQRLGDSASARSLYERALKIYREFLGEEHPNTIGVKNYLKSLG